MVSLCVDQRNYVVSYIAKPYFVVHILALSPLITKFHKTVNARGEKFVVVVISEENNHFVTRTYMRMKLQAFSTPTLTFSAIKVLISWLIINISPGQGP